MVPRHWKSIRYSRHQRCVRSRPLVCRVGMRPRQPGTGVPASFSVGREHIAMLREGKLEIEERKQVSMREYGMVPAVACMEMFQPCVGLMSISKHVRPPGGRLGPGYKRDNLTGDGAPHSRCERIGDCTMRMKTGSLVDSALNRACCSTITCSYVGSWLVFHSLRACSPHHRSAVGSTSAELSRLRVRDLTYGRCGWNWFHPLLYRVPPARKVDRLCSLR